MHSVISLLLLLLTTGVIAIPFDFLFHSPGTLSGGQSILSNINEWRTAYGVAKLSWNNTLASNAQKTGRDNGGLNEKHELNHGTSSRKCPKSAETNPAAGSMAQVISPGIQDQDICGRNMDRMTPFGLIHMGWLCEVATDPQLKGGCSAVLEAAHLYVTPGETGHHDILTNTKYSKIGCAFSRHPAALKCVTFTGLWVCDLA